MYLSVCHEKWVVKISFSCVLSNKILFLKKKKKIIFTNYLKKFVNQTQISNLTPAWAWLGVAYARPKPIPRGAGPSARPSLTDSFTCPHLCTCSFQFACTERTAVFSYVILWEKQSWLNKWRESLERNCYH